MYKKKKKIMTFYTKQLKPSTRAAWNSFNSHMQLHACVLSLSLLEHHKKNKILRANMHLKKITQTVHMDYQWDCKVPTHRLKYQNSYLKMHVCLCISLTILTCRSFDVSFAAQTQGTEWSKLKRAARKNWSNKAMNTIVSLSVFFMLLTSLWLS